MSVWVRAVGQERWSTRRFIVIEEEPSRRCIPGRGSVVYHLPFPWTQYYATAIRVIGTSPWRAQVSYVWCSNRSLREWERDEIRYPMPMPAVQPTGIYCAEYGVPASIELTETLTAAIGLFKSSHGPGHYYDMVMNNPLFAYAQDRDPKIKTVTSFFRWWQDQETFPVLPRQYMRNGYDYTPEGYGSVVKVRPYKRSVNYEKLTHKKLAKMLGL